MSPFHSIVNPLYKRKYPLSVTAYSFSENGAATGGSHLFLKQRGGVAVVGENHNDLGVPSSLVGGGNHEAISTLLVDVSANFVESLLPCSFPIGFDKLKFKDIIAI